ncbi:MAG: hypothetical protein H0W14_11815 [Actinobacteria bacterium]|nr:hypothetical protein [Actinomycetota bacterium]
MTRNGKRRPTRKRGFTRGELTLVVDVAARIPRPVEPLEVAAVLETMGVTDAIAVEDYDAETTFDLAERIFAPVRTVAAGQAPNGTATEHAGTQTLVRASATLAASIRGATAITPLVVLLLTAYALGTAGWSAGSILAFSLGIVAAMLLTGGPVFALTRRISVHLVFDQGHLARAFLARGAVLISLALVCVSAAILAVSYWPSLFTETERVIFTATMAGAGIVWLLVAGVTAAGAPGWAGAALAGGLAAGSGIAWAVRGDGGTDATVGLLAGLAVALLLLAVGASRLYPRGREKIVLLPPGLLLLEAWPYALFGSGLIFLFVVPHVVGWLGSVPAGSSRVDAISSLELSLVLALPPVMLATGVLERVFAQLWPAAEKLQQTSDRERFVAAVARFHRRRQQRYLTVLGALSFVAAGLFELTDRAGWLETWSPGASRLVFLSGLVAFFFFGWGQMNCLFILSLAKPGRALTPISFGAAVVILLGVPLALTDFRLAAPAFAVAAAVFAVTALAKSRTVMASADYHYATAF